MRYFTLFQNCPANERVFTLYRLNISQTA